MPTFGSSGMVTYSTSIVIMAVSRTVSEIQRLFGQKSPIFLTPLYSAPPLGVKPSELSMHNFLFPIACRQCQEIIYAHGVAVIAER